MALLVLTADALLGPLVRCSPLYATSPLLVQNLGLLRHRGAATGNHGAPLDDQMHLPTYSDMSSN